MPMFSVLVPAVAILIVWSTLSLPILSAPPLELSSITPVASRAIEAVFAVVRSLENVSRSLGVKYVTSRTLIFSLR